MTYPFVRSPDAFFLCFDELPPEIKTAAFESPWGITDEVLCTFNETLIGKIARNRNTAIVLLPNLDRMRNYSWPSAHEFLEALWTLLLSSRGWYIHCERDCDQEPVAEIRDMVSLRELLKQLIDVCSKGEVAIPTFRATDSQISS
ncbi:MAG: hypothetical protein AB7G28_05070 [Pirellulales bacterium]